MLFRSYYIISKAFYIVQTIYIIIIRLNGHVVSKNEILEVVPVGDVAAAAAQALTNQARNQNAIRNLRQTKSQSSDWRVRLKLAPNSQYLYNATNPGDLLYPLRVTDGVIFPYTPTIDTSYQAKYQNADLVHSNYRGYFYQNSYVDAINIKATFTAQDTYEAAYLLAVIHFFRSVTKMFYGQDPQRGTPPPLVYLSGFGQYQFENHPCVVSNFSYTLPSDVDYIRAVGFNNYGVNMDALRNPVSGPGLGGTLGNFIKQKFWRSLCVWCEFVCVCVCVCAVYMNVYF